MSPSISSDDERLSEKMTDVSPESLSHAVVVWTGFDRCSSPNRNKQRVVDEFGSEAAKGLIVKVMDLYKDFYSSSANDRARTLQEMGEMALNEFKTRHPELSNDALEALAWCFAWDYK